MSLRWMFFIWMVGWKSVLHIRIVTTIDFIQQWMRNIVWTIFEKKQTIFCIIEDWHSQGMAGWTKILAAFHAVWINYL